MYILLPRQRIRIVYMSRAFNFNDLYQSYYTWYLVVRVSTKAYIMHLVGTVDRRGYSGQQKGTISDNYGLYPVT